MDSQTVYVSLLAFFVVFSIPILWLVAYIWNRKFQEGVNIERLIDDIERLPESDRAELKAALIAYQELNASWDDLTPNQRRKMRAMLDDFLSRDQDKGQ